MAADTRIITVGLAPAWDITCRGRDIRWGAHQHIDGQTIHPAGKALNVSRALAWLGRGSIAAGLWGRNDYQQMLTAVQSAWPLITVRMSAVAGDTRRNVTIVDAAKGKEMHLRNRSPLASAAALMQLKTDLGKIVRRGSICVFAGTMPEGGLLDRVVRIVDSCASRGARIVLDTSGPALRRIVDAGQVWLIKPNVEELRQLSGRKIKDEPASLAAAARGLLDKVEMVLVSRGAKGGLLVSKHGVWQARCVSRAKVLSTVGCGDYLLAGFLNDFLANSDPGSALKNAIKVATARAWGWTEGNTCRQALRGAHCGKRKIEVTVERT